MKKEQVMDKETDPAAVQLNIAIIPSARIQDEAIRLSELLSRNFDTHFALNTQDLFPHITISQARYPERNLGRVIDVVRNTATEFKPFMIRLNPFDVRLGQFVFWNAERTQELVAFHQKVVDGTNPLREGLVIEHVAAMEDLSPEDSSDREKYGALLIGPHYQPHITLTRLKQNTPVSEVARVIGKGKQDQFNVAKIVVGYLGNHGTVNGIIEEVPLG